MEKLFLIKPDMTFADQIMDFRREFLAADSSMDGCGGLRHFDDALSYVQTCEKYADPATVPPGRVPDTQLMLVRAEDRRLLGMIQIRDTLNDYLRSYGGHIGYSIRPTERRKGYAKEMLRLALIYCREIGLTRVMITCEEGNIASEKTILAGGGVYESTVYEPKEKLKLKRFWITL